MKPARKETALRAQASLADPSFYSLPRRLGNLELDRPLGFLLQNDRPRCDCLPVAHIPHLKLDQVAGTELTVNCEVEKGEFATPIGKLRTVANSPDLAQLERRLLTDKLALVEGVMAVEL
jgi:hypothetical protein